MSIVTPTIVHTGYPVSNVGTDAARRDNAQREIIPALLKNEKSASEKGLGNEGEQRSQQAFNQPTYDKPSVQQTQSFGLGNEQSQKDNASDESAGKQNQEKQQEQAEAREVKELKARDQEVRTHEQAHASVGGQYAGSPQYEYETGPDNKQYAVSGEVSIDVSEESTPDKTIDKMQQVRAAALAPAEPSAQDYKVAAEAQQTAQRARAELNMDDDKLDTAKQVIQQYYTLSYQPRANQINLVS